MPDGTTISWSHKTYSKEFATFQLPCGKCLECRLEYARQWAVRCVHEAKMHPENSFITLTYDDQHLESPKLIYSDFQKFMKRLRRAFPNQQIGCFVTGEYGDEKKRPHWHAILFNWRPRDCKPKYKNDRDDQVYSSETLHKLWEKGIAELGSVTFESAGYCARYAAKKLVHGKDSDHEFHPISKKSNKHAIGKKWLEANWRDVFTHGYIILPDGKQCSIPRYYEKWLKENEPSAWTRYVTQTKNQKMQTASEKAEAEQQEYLSQNDKRKDIKRLTPMTTKREARIKILDEKFKQLQRNLKL